MTTPSNWLTLREVARELDHSLEQVRRYVDNGRLTARKVGRQWFVKQSSLDRFNASTDNLPSSDFLVKARRLREEIEIAVGTVNVIELLDQVREGSLDHYSLKPTNRNDLKRLPPSQCQSR